MSADPAGWAEAELRRRYGEPTTDTVKMAGFTLQDSRQLAIQRDSSDIRLWLEKDSARDGVPAQKEKIRCYLAHEGRHSNLPPRLRPKALQPVCRVIIDDLPTLQAVLDWYDNGKGVGLDRVKLEQYRQIFMARYPDFASFAQNDGGYFAEERAYKNKLLEHAATAMASEGNELALGARLLDLLTSRGGVPSGLLGWRTDAKLAALRAAHPDVLELAAGRLARTEKIDKAIIEFVTATWSLLIEGQTSKHYGESRNLPTMLAALAHPSHAYGINTDPVQRTAQALLGRKLLGSNPMTAEEYAAVYGMAEAIRKVMADDWGWMPRDMWDVQGFVWAMNLPEQTKPLTTPVIVSPTKETALAKNLIFYGPPGTGKTYATAAEAVQLCGENVPEDRAELMAVYQRLADAGRIEFVTFHQSTAYEEFVEGLRPMQTSESGTAGFELQPVPGIFRRIARRAETSTGSGEIDIASQQNTGTGNPEPFVLIIDEINRANVSKVFGELITLLEPDKRLGQSNALRVRLPYSGDSFGVPGNLHIIGTMNTADRSIALLDTALRRRFSFIELMPRPSLLGTVEDVDLATLLTKINDTVEYLFDREHQVGHAYFADCKTRADVDAVMRHRVIPLLAEYFHEDWEKIAATLGDSEEAEGDHEGGFLDRRQLSAPVRFANASETMPRYRWVVRAVFDYSKLQ